MHPMEFIDRYISLFKKKTYAKRKISDNSQFKIIFLFYKKIPQNQGIWLVQSIENVTLETGVVSLRPRLGTDYLKRKKKSHRISFSQKCHN